MSYNLNILTAALSERYKHFIVPFIVSHLYFNPNACVEILIDCSVFSVKKSFINFLNRFFSDRCNIYDYRKINSKFELFGNKEGSNAAIRFLTVPKNRSNYTYITDLDTLCLETNIEKKHIQHMNFIGLPYSNVIRRKLDRLSGLHFVSTYKYYHILNKRVLDDLVNNILNKNLNLVSDEHFLFKLMEKYIGLPERCLNYSNYDPNTYGFRPIHGFHTTLHRDPIYWGVVQYRKENYNKLCNSEVWKASLGFMDKKYYDVLKKINSFY